MKLIARLFGVLHASMAALFACASLMLIVIATKSGEVKPEQFGLNSSDTPENE